MNRDSEKCAAEPVIAIIGSETTVPSPKSVIARNAGWILAGKGMQLMAQFGYFLIIARELGPAGYGTFLACTALAAVLAPFSPLGTGQVLVKYTSRNKALMPAYLGNALLVTSAMGMMLIAAICLVRHILLPPAVSIVMVLAVGTSDLIFAQATYVFAQALLAAGHAKQSSSLMVVSACARFSAAVLLVTTGAPTLHRWVIFYLFASITASAYGFTVMTICCAGPRFTLGMLRATISEGAHFSTSLAAQTIYNDIDKTMLARLSSVQGAAIYAVAYRFIEVAMLPMRSLQSAAYPEFFRHGIGGMTRSFQFARRILRRSVLYGVAASIGLFVCARFVPLIMGSAYAESTVALKWLCLLPLIQSVHAFLGDALTGANLQPLRSWCQIAIALFNILINLWFIRAWAWHGAACSSILSETLLATLFYLAIRLHLGKRQRSAGSNGAIVDSVASEAG
ncbi:MAG TPA: oligosaccharide flippase family protein [Terracidiphilus sp.]|nr:oligosaccharide flippase family protein [Terracidiphilus sp.]